MVGIPGAGKSYFAEHFASTFNALIINSERLRKELFKSPSFSKSEDIVLTKITNYMLAQFLKTGQTIIYIGQTNSRTDRALITKKANDASYEPLFVWVQTEPATAQKRATKPIDKSLALNIEQFNDKLKKFKAPNNTEKTVVISGKHTHASQTKIVLKHLATPCKSTTDQKTNIRQSDNNILIR
ncbi:MAG: hypothetical protein PWQ10_326 [Patescibacteria group bacterium]|nr:hypothetical protein [Patescibacteria group bacterium]